MFVSFQNSYVDDVLVPWRDGIRRWDLGEVIRSRGWSPHDGINVLLKRQETDGFSLDHMKTWTKGSHLGIGRQALPGH